eukprot:TRINITY_DN11462_c0_g1_i1.p2 TRINITY_DN11462_c0_g1~~TRINITY_DN11462_c0_g1_i1.p2  ORF type:complete len:188 (-),score=53.32 TRINITY_DN11462_c0_g1_i1:10-573(-)
MKKWRELGQVHAIAITAPKKSKFVRIRLLLFWNGQIRLTLNKDLSKYQTRKQKKSKTFPLTASEKAKIKKVQAGLSSYKVEKLKTFLRENNLTITGSKAQLIERIAESKVLGGIEKCSECGGGRPTWDDHGFWYCKGYMDDDTWVDCCFVSKTIVRTPWKKGGEEEEEESEEEEEESEEEESEEESE